MLVFSKKEDYAFVLITKLVQNFGKKLVPLSEVAKEYKISPLFLRNIANVLKTNGLIKAQEGVNGGYCLAKKPQKIKVAEIIFCFSKKPFFDCCSSGCTREEICPTSASWKKINKEFLNKIYNLSLTEFINEK